MGEPYVCFFAGEDGVDEGFVEIEDEELLLCVFVKDGVPDGSASFTFFLLMYYWEGPFRLLME